MSEFPDVPWSDEIGQELEDDFALTDAGQGWHQIGKTDVSLTRFIEWANKIPTEVSHEEWKKLPANQRGHDFLFTVDIAEFNQRAKDESWDYRRRVQFKSDDWFKILVPSFELVFGKGSMNAKSFMGTIGKIKGAYVDWLDVTQSPHRKTGKIAMNENTGKPYTTLKLIKVFGSQAEAQKAAGELSTSNGVSPDSIYPALWVDESSVEKRLEEAKLLVSDDWNHLARQMELVDENGKIAQTTNGNEVNIALIISKLFNIKEGTIREQMQPQEVKTPF